MALNRRIEDLDDRIRDKAIAFLEALKAANISVFVNETRRSAAVQKAYYAQGRYALADVNKLRREAGLWAITDKENHRHVTWTLNSKHIDGLALDVIPLDSKGRAWWNAPSELWNRIGEIGESCGLTWGGRWVKNPDKPHYEV